MPVGSKKGYKAIGGGGTPGKSAKTDVKKVTGKKAAPTQTAQGGNVRGKASPIKKATGKRAKGR